MKNLRKHLIPFFVLFFLVSCSWVTEPDPCEGSGHNATEKVNNITLREESSFCGSIKPQTSITHPQSGVIIGYRYEVLNLTFLPYRETFDLTTADSTAFDSLSFDLTFNLLTEDFHHTKVDYFEGNIKLRMSPLYANADYAEFNFQKSENAQSIKGSFRSRTLQSIQNGMIVEEVVEIETSFDTSQSF